MTLDDVETLFINSPKLCVNKLRNKIVSTLLISNTNTLYQHMIIKFVRRLGGQIGKRRY